jgi:hypothetical protein
MLCVTDWLSEIYMKLEHPQLSAIMKQPRHVPVVLLWGSEPALLLHGKMPCTSAWKKKAPRSSAFMPMGWM